jgi:hypothetical protein
MPCPYNRCRFLGCISPLSKEPIWTSQCLSVAATPLQPWAIAQANPHFCFWLFSCDRRARDLLSYVN